MALIGAVEADRSDVRKVLVTSYLGDCFILLFYVADDLRHMQLKRLDAGLKTCQFLLTCMCFAICSLLGHNTVSPWQGGANYVPSILK